MLRVIDPAHLEPTGVRQHLDDGPRGRDPAPRRHDGIYGVVDKPDYALVIACDGDRFPLVEQFRYPLGLRRWEFPQGTVADRYRARRVGGPGIARGDRPAGRA